MAVKNKLGRPLCLQDLRVIEKSVKELGEKLALAYLSNINRGGVF